MLEKKIEKWRKNIRIERGTQEIDLESIGIVNPTGYQRFRGSIDVYLNGRKPENSNGEIIPINPDVEKLTIRYGYGMTYPEITFH